MAVAETAVGDVRGEEGFFHYCGYGAAELARHCSFEQVWHLLLHGIRQSTRQALPAKAPDTSPDDLNRRLENKGKRLRAISAPTASG